MSVTANVLANSTLDSSSGLLGTGSGAHFKDGAWKELFPEIIGRGPAMSHILETVSKLARSDGAVLISGESGTGKELIASAIHRLSARSHNRFIPINCSAIPEELLESELFGHEKGAFTGADRRRAGHFEMADSGTIFLDEIGDMPLRLQAKLLRVLQERQYMPLGGSEIKKADVRIIAATNVDLMKAIKDGRFREDLYYRLNVLPVHMPSLRERQSDIPMLLEYYLERSNRIHLLGEPCFFTRDCLENLSRYDWPGNVRELQNLVERLVVLRGGGEIRIEHLPRQYDVSLDQRAAAEVTVANSQALRSRGETVLLSTRSDQLVPNHWGSLPDEGLNLPEFIETLENTLILQALARTQNNKNQAARLLGLNRTTLVERIKKRRIGTGVDEE